LPPSSSILYFLCRASPFPMTRTFTFSWFCITFACCLHQFRHAIINMRYLERHVKIPDRCELRNLPVVPRTLFYRRYHFKRWVSATYFQAGQA
jgi:hypothetical protein